MDIEGLGEQRVELFVERKLLNDVADLYSFAADTFEGIEGFGTLSTANLLGAIEASRSRPLHRLLIGLGIRHLGQVGSLALARAFGSLDGIISADEPALAAVDGVGPVIAASVAQWFASDANRGVVERLRRAGVNVDESGGMGERGNETVGRAGGGNDGSNSSAEPSLVGKSVVVTGTLEGFTREEAEEAILSRGGRSPGSVSKKTFAVVVGSTPGASKVTKAEQLGIPIVDGSEQFAVLLATGDVPTVG